MFLDFTVLDLYGIYFLLKCSAPNYQGKFFVCNNLQTLNLILVLIPLNIVTRQGGSNYRERKDFKASSQTGLFKSAAGTGFHGTTAPVQTFSLVATDDRIIRICQHFVGLNEKVRQTKATSVNNQKLNLSPS